MTFLLSDRLAYLRPRGRALGICDDGHDVLVLLPNTLHEAITDDIEPHGHHEQ